MSETFIHPSSDVSKDASLGKGTKVWQMCQIRAGARLGQNCILGKGVYVDANVQIGDNCKIQNGISLYEGVTLQDGVFCGPHCVFSNDFRPRAINPDGSLKSPHDWVISKTLVCTGAAIGANATIVCGVTIGAWAMVGAGAVVTRNVPDYGLVYGNPARLVGLVCPCGDKLSPSDEIHPTEGEVVLTCSSCGKEITVPAGILTSLVSTGSDQRGVER